MNNKEYIQKALFFVLVFAGLIQSCDTLKIDSYGNERALYFERYITEGKGWKYVDTAVLSLINYPNRDLIMHPFRVCLIGDTLPEDVEYSVMVVDSLTTAREGMVTLPERIVFQKGRVIDSLWLTVHADRLGKNKEYYITYQLMANANFGVGYKGYTQVKLWFHNRSSQPLWWTQRVVDVYLGVWSAKKFETLIIATEGINSFEGLSASEMRYYSLLLKEYIRVNGITETDGSPMIVPIY